MPDISPPPYDDKKTGAEDESCVVEEDGGFRIAYWVDKNVRQTFIRKVYSIITLQLLMTVGIVAVFTFAFIFLICYFVLVFCRSIQRRFPWNIILMTIFTMAMGFMTCAIASTYDSKSVILAMIITAIVTIIVTVFSFQTKVDITSWRGFFCILAIVLTVTSIVTAIVLTCKYMYWLHMLYSAISAIAFTLFLAYDTQLLLGDKKYAISPEDYIYGAIQIYVDVIYIFLSFTRLVSRN
ncbi:protein lifeguard 3-like isoform X2 [Rhineura floridana]|uniref:protein lifeguard 3-like isoform X2 n=1 Tax=Rhineura floridana TaxID=261503 RepID=UPI002AC872E2|nr:protein lifeguard 3-like isoform X2 [Rhineura floridana]